MQAWLGADGVDIATIGFLSLVGLPYTFKFLWAPLMDRFEPPWLGRRRGWLVVTQLALAGALLWMAATPPASSLAAFALLAGLVAWLSASQDVVFDAYRVDLLPAAERGFGSSLMVLGYRLAMIVSGGIAFIWVDPQQGSGMSWPDVYRLMALFMVGAAVFSALFAPRLAHAPQPTSAPATTCSASLPWRRAVAAGFLVTRFALSPLARAIVVPMFAGSSVAPGPAGTLGRPARAARGHRSHRAARCLGGAAGPLRDLPGRACRTTSRSRAPPRSSGSSSSTSCPTRSPARCSRPFCCSRCSTAPPRSASSTR